jgi:hypothetical protein
MTQTSSKNTFLYVTISTKTGLNFKQGDQMSL